MTAESAVTACAESTIDTCPKCGGPVEDLTETAVNVDQFRREDGRCFLFLSKECPLLECRSNGWFSVKV